MANGRKFLGTKGHVDQKNEENSGCVFKTQPCVFFLWGVRKSVGGKYGTKMGGLDFESGSRSVSRRIQLDFIFQIKCNAQNIWHTNVMLTVSIIANIQKLQKLTPASNVQRIQYLAG